MFPFIQVLEFFHWYSDGNFSQKKKSKKRKKKQNNNKQEENTE